MDTKDYVLNQEGKLPSAHNDSVWAFDLGMASLGDSPAPRWGRRQRMRPAMIGKAGLSVSRPCRTGHLGGAAAPPDQSNQTGWNRESREPREIAQHRRCNLFVEGPKVRNLIARAIGPGCQIKIIFRGLKDRSNIHVADGPALQAGRRWGGTSSRPFRPGYHIAGFQPSGNGVRNTADVPTPGPKARNVIARPEGPGGRTTKISQGLQGRSNVSPLQGWLKLVGTYSRASSPGYHIAGFQPSGYGNEIIGKCGGADRLRNAVNQLQSLLYTT